MASKKSESVGDELATLVKTPLTSKATAPVAPAPALMATRSKQAKHSHLQPQAQQTFQLELLPVIVLDKIFGLLEAQDLRRVHQVSKGWKKCIVERRKVDLRRVELVEWIRLNKENAPKGTTCVPFLTPSTKETPPTWRNQNNNNNGDDGKPGGRGILSSTESARNVSVEKCKSISSKSRRGTDLTTPTSRFFRFYEAGKKLPKGQQLFRCPECQSPVPSPMSVTSTKSSRSRRLTCESSSSSSWSTPHQIQMPTSTSITKTSTSGSSISSPNSTQDSGFESIEVSSQYSSSLTDLSSSCQILDSTYSLDSTDLTSESHPTPLGRPTDEITLSFIATPDDTLPSYSNNKNEFYFSQDSGTEEDPQAQLFEDEEEEEQDQVFDDQDSSLKTPNSVKCPACSYRFCSKCQCSDHPGRSCRLIGSGNGKRPKDLTCKKRTKEELRRAARL